MKLRQGRLQSLIGWLSFLVVPNMVLSKMNTHEHLTKRTYESYTFQPLMSFWSNIKVLQIKQNHIVRILFFSTLYRKNAESPLPLINLLSILTVNHIYELQALRCIRKWHKQELLSIFNSCSHYAKNIHSHNTRYTSKDNLYMTRFGTNTGKQAISATAVDLRQELTPDFKPLSTSLFSKRVKQYLLIKQNSSSDI